MAPTVRRIGAGVLALMGMLGATGAVSMVSAWRTPLLAQVDPRVARRTIETAHVRVHFAPEQEVMARRTAAFAEHAWRELSRELVAPRVRSR